MYVDYQELKTEISQAQLFAQEFRQEIGGQLRLINTDIGSFMSIDRRHQEDISQRFMKALDELKQQKGFENELIRTALVSHILNPFYDIADRNLFKGVDRISIQNAGSRQATGLARTRNSVHFIGDPPGCTCKRQHEYSKLSYRLWHAAFEYEQLDPGHHARGCRYFGIDQPTKRIAKAQLLFKLWSLSSRLFLTCIEYSLGTSTPGMSIRWKRIVPKSHSPVHNVLKDLFKNLKIRSREVTANEISLKFAEAERAILSLYRDRESSPYDHDEDGNSHALVSHMEHS